jgi:hypothetical protein
LEGICDSILWKFSFKSNYGRKIILDQAAKKAIIISVLNHVQEGQKSYLIEE